MGQAQKNLNIRNQVLLILKIKEKILILKMRNMNTI